MGADLAQRVGAVAAGGGELEVLGAPDRRGEPVDVDRMVVRDEHPDRLVSWRHRSSF
jgi:hypothetical protein